jgi:hypothetical protein
MSTIDQLRAEWMRHVAQYEMMKYILKKSVSLRKPSRLTRKRPLTHTCEFSR